MAAMSWSVLQQTVENIATNLDKYSKKPYTEQSQGKGKGRASNMPAKGSKGAFKGSKGKGGKNKGSWYQSKGKGGRHSAMAIYADTEDKRAKAYEERRCFDCGQT